jgi:hypothetical protein
LTVSIFDPPSDTVTDTVKILSFYRIPVEYSGHKKTRHTLRLAGFWIARDHPGLAIGADGRI